MRACSTACGVFFGSLSPGAPLPEAPPPRGPAAGPLAGGLAPAGTAAHQAAAQAAPISSAVAHSLHVRLRSLGQQPPADIGASLPAGMVPLRPPQLYHAR